MFEHGDKKRGGRTKGTPNKSTAELKSAILGAFSAVGGRDYLAEVARSDPRTFCALLGRVLPSELRAEIAGGVGNELMILDYSRASRRELGDGFSR